jgi:isopenicillin-N N-acyltransferase like protein
MKTSRSLSRACGLGRWYRRLLALALLLHCGAAQAAPQGPAQSGPAPKREVKVLRLEGSAYQRGLQHGTELRPEIATVVNLWKDDIAKTTRADPDVIIKTFLAETRFQPAIERWTPGLLDEVRGIADGAKQPFDTMFAFQLVDELWVFIDKRVADRCTAVGVARAGSHPAYVAQNLDLEPFRDGFQLVLHIAGSLSAPEQFVFTSVGLIGASGVNSRSIAIACNTLMQLNASTDGLPVAFIVRGVLAQNAGDAAVEFIKSIKHASGQNYIVGTGDRVRDFEASAGKVVEFRPAPDGSVVYHTNHPLANDDLKPWHRRAIEALPPELRRAGNSEVRLASIRKRMERPAAAIDDRVIADALRSRDSESHPICRSLRPGTGAFTFGAVIMTLSSTPSLQVTMGPPDVNRFVRLEFFRER